MTFDSVVFPLLIIYSTGHWRVEFMSWYASIISTLRRWLMLQAGQDNGSVLCSVGEVEDLFDGVVSDHDGPYDGVHMGAGC